MSSLYTVYYEFLMNKIGAFILYQSRHLCYDIDCIALVAQLDRAAGFYPAGRGFDSPSTHFNRFTTITSFMKFISVATQVSATTAGKRITLPIAWIIYSSK